MEEREEDKDRGLWDPSPHAFPHLFCFPSPSPPPAAPHLFCSPSHLRVAVNTTVLAGMLRPMAKVSVANSTWGRNGEGGNGDYKKEGGSPAPLHCLCVPHPCPLAPSPP